MGLCDVGPRGRKLPTPPRKEDARAVPEVGRPGKKGVEVFLLHRKSASRAWSKPVLVGASVLGFVSRDQDISDQDICVAVEGAGGGRARDLPPAPVEAFTHDAGDVAGDGDVFKGAVRVFRECPGRTFSLT
ncbi:hypothetical protein FFA01_22790 [Frigoribacterium faeni]|uniref:Uncharacterized protein n=1 Tax=Frigoribacterium faeni TaxID=145483 RepID=A0ABQ0UR83_9MICO|nr:hypothetical protein GCM10025699_42970 [Microbacterium flavescens]GEK83970.1 hypothetical protein FFA01_22790 [Frigoribacterium faeni]